MLDEGNGDFDDDLWDHVRPEPTPEEEAHNDEHGQYPESYYDRHDAAYEQALDDPHRGDPPDHEDTPLMKFIENHGTNRAHWQQHATYGGVNLKRPVYATQSHVSQGHIDKYLKDPGAPTHTMQRRKVQQSDYLGDGAPMFVTHEGRLHTIEGHHRVAAALQRGDSHIMGWHFDADQHGFPPNHDEDEDDEDW
jgi:hypothetical protein